MNKDTRAKLKEIIDQAKKEIFVKGYESTFIDEETMGVLLSQYFKWDGRSIYKVAYNAFEDSNFHSFNEKFVDLWHEREEKNHE
jgi:hypothetical protein